MSEKSKEQTKTLTALERLEALEKEMVKLNNLAKVLQAVGIQIQKNSSGLQNVNSNLDVLLKRLSALESVLESGNLLKISDVDVKMHEMEANRRLQQEENLIRQGLLEESLEGATLESFIAVQQKDNKSGAVDVIREHVNMSTLNEEAKKMFLGKTVGENVVFGDKTIKILRVLNPVKQGSVSEESESKSANSSESSQDSENKSSSENG